MKLRHRETGEIVEGLFSVNVWENGWEQKRAGDRIMLFPRNKWEPMPEPRWELVERLEFNDSGQGVFSGGYLVAQTVLPGYRFQWMTMYDLTDGDTSEAGETCPVCIKYQPTRALRIVREAPCD